MNIIRKSHLKTTSKDVVKEGFRTDRGASQVQPGVHLKLLGFP
jgi:hypothetical protein